MFWTRIFNVVSFLFSWFRMVSNQIWNGATITNISFRFRPFWIKGWKVIILIESHQN